MSPNKYQMISLSKWVDSKQSQGRYSFTREEALLETGLKDETFRKAALRLAGERRIARIHLGFYVIVPLEYRSQGVTPADWFIADLMAYLRQPYYVGLLSAAAYHGASHQRVQQYHVITNQRKRQAKCHSLVLRFFTKAGVTATPQDQIKTSTGMIAISTPEATALDLVAYYRQVGGLDRVLTVLQELGEKLESDKIVDVAQQAGSMALVQRLGWLLEQTEYSEKASLLAEWILKSNVSPAVLQPALPKRGARRDRRWNLWLNTDVEGDLA